MTDERAGPKDYQPTTAMSAEDAVLTKKVLVTIEGLVSAGKSTLIRYAYDRLSSSFSHLQTVIPEAIDKYTTYKTYNPLWEMYDNPRQNAGIAQLHFIRAINDRVSESLVGPSYLPRMVRPISLVLQDRCLMSPEIFIKTHHALGNVTDFARDLLIEETRKSADATLADNYAEYGGIFYLDTSIDTCLERIRLRGRDGEANITEEYLRTLRDCQESFVKSYENGPMNVIRVNGEEPTEEIGSKLNRFLFDVLDRYWTTPAMALTTRTTGLPPAPATRDNTPSM